MMKMTMTCQKSRLRKKSTNENGNRKLRSCFFLNGKCDQFYHEKNDHHHQVQLSYNNTKIILHRKNILAKTRYDCFIKNQTLFLPTASDSCKLKRKLFLAEKKLIIMFCHKKLPLTNRKKCFFKKWEFLLFFEKNYFDRTNVRPLSLNMGVLSMQCNATICHMPQHQCS